MKRSVKPVRSSIRRRIRRVSRLAAPVKHAAKRQKRLRLIAVKVSHKKHG
jgi:hypothetical protein